MDGTNPLLVFIGSGALTSVLIAAATIFSSRKLTRANTEGRIVESAVDQNDRLVLEAKDALAERNALRQVMRERDRLAEVHEEYDRLMIREARDCPAAEHHVWAKPPLYPPSSAVEWVEQPKPPKES